MSAAEVLTLGRLVAAVGLVVIILAPVAVAVARGGRS